MAIQIGLMYLSKNTHTHTHTHTHTVHVHIPANTSTSTQAATHILYTNQHTHIPKF